MIFFLDVLKLGATLSDYIETGRVEADVNVSSVRYTASINVVDVPPPPPAPPHQFSVTNKSDCNYSFGKYQSAFNTSTFISPYLISIELND